MPLHYCQFPADVEGDMIPFIEEFAVKGWTLRASLPLLYPHRTGTELQVPIHLIFEAPLGVGV